MIYIEAPEEPPAAGLSVFLAGGITGCPDWQAEAVALLAHLPVILCNPRQAHFDVTNPHAAEAQILWEYRQLRRVEAVLFWFPRETLCPIVLYELGAWSMTHKPLFVGTHPSYPRRQDVEIQTRLARPEIEVVHDLGILANQVTTWLKEAS